jgi:branched-subunit amino acid ABC-type transport system permease component
MEQIFQVILLSIFLGGIYAIIASGLSIIWGIVGIINLSHGALLLFAGFAAIFMISLTTNALLGFLFAILLSSAIMVIFQMGVLNKIIKLTFTTFVATLGATYILEGIGGLWFGRVYGNIKISLFGLPAVIKLGMLDLPSTYLEGFLIGLVTLTLLHQFLSRTYTGNAIIAVSQDSELCETCGINPGYIFITTAALAGTLIGIGGFIYLRFFAASIGDWVPVVAKSFAIALLIGRRVNILGLLTGGILLALLENIATLYFIPMGYRDIITAFFVILVLVLKYRHEVKL